MSTVPWYIAEIRDLRDRLGSMERRAAVAEGEVAGLTKRLDGAVSSRQRVAERASKAECDAVAMRRERDAAVQALRDLAWWCDEQSAMKPRPTAMRNGFKETAERVRDALAKIGGGE